MHIADVSHFVKKGGVLDVEAEKRATSVYLVDRVVPMLPEKISNEIAVQIFTKIGPIAFLPISNYETSIVYSITKDQSNFNDEANPSGDSVALDMVTIAFGAPPSANFHRSCT